MTEVWKQEKIINWSQIILNSYEQIVGKKLIARTNNKIEDAKALFLASFVVVSHGRESIPILNYGNQIALDLWEMEWDNFTQTPSTKTVEHNNIKEAQRRQEMLQQVQQKGYIDNYECIRITITGKRFFIKNAIVFNLINNNNQPCGQAATFSEWKFLEN